jgi:hypothetical protein
MFAGAGEPHKPGKKLRNTAFAALTLSCLLLMLHKPQFPEYVDFRNTAGIVRSRFSVFWPVHSLLANQRAQSSLH